MTIKAISYPAAYIGLSTDSKPVSVPPGTTFLEYDTGALYVTYDGTNWIAGASNLVESRPNARRAAGILHRDAVTAVDKITDFVDGSVTIANVGGTQGSLAFNTAHYMTAIPGNRWGSCKVNSNIDTETTTSDAANTHVLACTIAQAVGAEWYDLFLSVDAAPKWVGRITEAQRVAGGEILTVGVITAGASAGVFNVGIVGTGIQTSNALFAQNNAYRPATVTALDCSGYSTAWVLAKLTVTDLRSAPSLSLVPFFKNQLSSGDWHQGDLTVVPLLAGLGGSLEKAFRVTVEGETGLVLLLDAIGGQNASCSVWVELA